MFARAAPEICRRPSSDRRLWLSLRRDPMCKRRRRARFAADASDAERRGSDSFMAGTWWFPSATVSEREIRTEIWRLGTRHRGMPLEGALDELKAPGLPTSRAQLLRACVRKLKSS